MRALRWLTAAIALAGCAANQQYFQPEERVQGMTEQGRKLAIYPLTVARGPVGEAKIWSGGAYETESEDTRVQIGLEVHNTSGAPMALEPGDLTLAVKADDYGSVSDLRPEEDRAQLVPPGAVARVSSTFTLPPGITPGDIEAMRLDWRVRADGQVYAQSTRFTEEVKPRYNRSDPCGPYGCGSIGWAYGPSWGYSEFPPDGDGAVD